MKDLIVDLFGSYEPVLTEMGVVVTDVDGYAYLDTYEVVASGAAGLDWPWIMGVLLFAIVLWSLFRLLGVFFK